MQKNSDFNKPSIVFNTKDRESIKDYDRIHSTDKKINIKETVEKKNSYDELISLGWKEEKHESNFSLLSKNQSNSDNHFKLFESKNLMWEKSFSSVISISNITPSGLVAIVWEKLSKSVEKEDPKPMCHVIDKHGKLKYEPRMRASPPTTVLHDTFFAYILPYPKNTLRCYSLIENQLKIWAEPVHHYGKIILSTSDDLIVLSRRKDGSPILKVNVHGDFQRFSKKS